MVFHIFPSLSHGNKNCTSFEMTLKTTISFYRFLAVIFGRMVSLLQAVVWTTRYWCGILHRSAQKSLSKPHPYSSYTHPIHHFQLSHCHRFFPHEMFTQTISTVLDGLGTFSCPNRVKTKLR